MTYLAIHGDIGTGKTLLMTYLATTSGMKIYSNYHIEHPSATTVTPGDLARVEGPAVICLDEVYTWLESRISSAILSRYMSYILFQSRKRDLHFITTCQLTSSVDLRYRELSDYWIEAKVETIDSIPSRFKYTIIKNSPPTYPHRVIAVSAPALIRAVGGMYNTVEVVGSLDDMILEIDPSVMSSEVLRLADELIEQHPNVRWSQAVVSGYCLCQGYSERFSRALYQAIAWRLASSEKSFTPTGNRAGSRFP